MTLVNTGRTGRRHRGPRADQRDQHAVPGRGRAQVFAELRQNPARKGFDTQVTQESLLGPDADLPHPARPRPAAAVLDDEQRPGRRQPGAVLRQVQGQAAQQGHAQDDVRRRRGRRRGRRGAVRDQGLPAEPEPLPGARREDPQGRAALRPARHRQDAAGPRGGRRGGGAVLHDLRLGLRRDVRRCRCVPRARPVRAGQAELPRASSSSTRSTRSAASAAPAWAAGTTSASRRSTSCSSRWTASTPAAASSSSRPPTGPTSSTPRCCAPAASTGRSRSARPTSPAVARSWRCTPRASRSAPTSTSTALAKRTVGMSGADLANVINEAALLTARENGTLITGAALEEAVDRVDRRAAPQEPDHLREGAQDHGLPRGWPRARRLGDARPRARLQAHDPAARSHRRARARRPRGRQGAS